MQFTAYIYRSLFGDQPIDQVETIRQIEIEEQLDSFSVLSFMVDYHMSDDWVINTTNIKEFRRVKIVSEWNNSKTIFEWVIFEVIPDFIWLKVNCRDYRWFLESKRFLETDKTYSLQESNTILTDLLNSLNAKTSADTYPEQWSFSADENKTWLSPAYKIGTSYFTIFKKLALLMWKSWYIKEWWIIEFKDIVWEDKTQWDKFTELVYTINAMDENTIWNIPSAVRQGTLANSIIDATGARQNNTTSIDDYIRLEDFQNMLSGEILNFLNKSSKPQLIYTLDVKFNELDNEVNIWDKLAIRIETWIIHLDIEWDLIITRKKSTIMWNEIQTLEVDVSEIDITRDTFLKKFKDVRQEIKNLKIG